MTQTQRSTLRAFRKRGSTGSQTLPKFAKNLRKTTRTPWNPRESLLSHPLASLQSGTGFYWSLRLSRCRFGSTRSQVRILSPRLRSRESGIPSLRKICEKATGLSDLFRKPSGVLRKMRPVPFVRECLRPLRTVHSLPERQGIEPVSCACPSPAAKADQRSSPKGARPPSYPSRNCSERSHLELTPCDPKAVSPHSSTGRNGGGGACFHFNEQPRGMGPR